MIHAGRFVAGLAMVFAAALAWSAIAVVLGDWAGLLPTELVASASAAPFSDDPCALRQFLPVGNDARCEFALARAGRGPLSVELVQTWASTNPAVLIQRLRVREQDARTSLMEIEWHSADTLVPRRVLRLAAVPSRGGEDHLVWMVGNCGGTACGLNDLTIVRWEGTRLDETLRRRFGTQAEIALDEGGLTVFDGSGRGVGAGFVPRVSRRFAFVGGVYVQLATDPVPTIPPP